MGECGSDPLCDFAAFEDWTTKDKSVANCFKAYCNGKLEQSFTPMYSGTYSLWQDMDVSCEGVEAHAECKSCPPNSVPQELDRRISENGSKTVTGLERESAGAEGENGRG